MTPSLPRLPDVAFAHGITALPEPTVIAVGRRDQAVIVFANRAALGSHPDLVGHALAMLPKALGFTDATTGDITEAVHQRRQARLQVLVGRNGPLEFDVVPLPAAGEDDVTLLRWSATRVGAEPAFDTIADHIPDPVFVLELDGEPPVRIAWVNRAAASSYGYTADEMIGQSILTLLDCPDTAAGARERIAQLRSGAVVTFEGVHCRKDGSKIPIEARCCMISWHGKPAALAIDRDLSNRQRSRAELAATADRLRLALAAGRMGTFDWEIATNRIHWSPFHYELFGYPADAPFDVTLDHFRDRVHPDDWPRLAASLETARIQREEYHHVARVVRPDGSVRWFSGTGRFHYDDRGIATRMLGVVRDETESHVAAAALGDRERFLTALIDGCPIGIQTFSPTGVSLRMNPAMQRLLGLPDPNIGVGEYNVLEDPETRRTGFAAKFAECVRGRTPQIEQHEIDFGAPGYARWPMMRRRALLESCFFPVFDETNAVASVVVFNWDVTERAEAERARQRLEEQLRQAQKLEAIALLAGGVAHDFNNVLTAVLGFSDMLRGVLPASDPNRELVDQIRLAAERGSGLTRQLLAFSRKQTVRAESFDPGTEVQQVVPMLRRLVEAKVQFQVEATPCGAVFVDRAQFQQVLLNLVVNARDAMPDGGKLTVRVEPGQLDAGMPAVRVTVADVGIGMTEEVKAHLFEPFFTTKAPGRGTGLGLATVHGIVTQSGGRIEIDSAPGKGTAVHVLWPRHDRAGLVTAHPAARDRGTVLVVDDDAVNRDLAAKILAVDGFRVLTASDGNDALARHGEQRIDLLVTDVMMPGMGGEELANRMCSRRPGLGVVFLSGYSGQALAPASLEAVRRWFLAKPYSADQLLRLVHRAAAR